MCDGCESSLYYLFKKTNIQRRIGMISKFKQIIAFTTVLVLALTILVGCSAFPNANTINKINANSYDPALVADVEPQKSVEGSESDMTIDASILEKDTYEKPNDEDPQEEQTIEKKVKKYLDKLKDKDYTSTYGEGYTWYIAAEELGMIGKPAISGLIDKLDSEDGYERALAIYGLLLASQHDNVKSFTHGEYINVNLDFDVSNHPEMVETAKAWWNKYKDNF